MHLLLHVCCAPCATVAVERLAAAGRRVTLCFCNPNIHPETERAIRADEARALAAALGLDISVVPGDPVRWREGVAPLAPRGEQSARCSVCFAIRLDAIATEALRLGCDGFTSTLTTARMKRSATIFRIGRMLGRKHGLEFLEEDFKKRDGFSRSAALAKEHGLYRQDYCGCEWSFAEAEERRNWAEPPAGAL